jgi:hypothetical protein
MTIDARQAGQAGAGQARGMQCRGPFVPGGASALYLNMALLFCIASQDEVRLLLLSLYPSVCAEEWRAACRDGIWNRHTACPFRIQHLEFENRSNNVADRKSKFNGFDRESIAEKLG